MNELKIAQELGLDDVKAFQLNDDDTVAAFTLEEAKVHYKRITGLDDEDAFREPTERSLDAMIWEDEHMKNKISIREAIKMYWEGEPFIVASSEW
ncbi:hypothetical protein [Peribacillus frigoritolerans]|uniref:hypothetical protein n=1 Tax=Peribacillus frigoritolerans TaxID=450367 RepID=UPI002161CF95|nr:hypothetical protein [Peribacillus frigoritolerans]